MPTFDVFVSYSRADQDAVERLGRALRERGLTVFVDRWYLVAGQSWPEALEKHLRDCRAVAVCIGASGMGAWQQREHYKALDRQAHEPGFPVIPVLLPGADDPALGFLGLNMWVDLRQGPEDAVTIEILTRAARGLPPGDDAALAPDPRAAICPYRGLLPFREEDADFFIGRETFIATLIEKVRSNSLVAVVGASGSGKSSVVRAGLVPALRRGADNHVWEILTLAPGPTPLHALLAALSPPPEDMSRAARLARIKRDVLLLRERGLTIDAFARDILSEQPGTDRLLLVVDQWEELYAQAKSIDDRQRFLDLILQATADGSVTVVLTLRGDFYGRALEDRAFADRLQNAVVNLGPMLREELERAVTEPAAKVGLRFEDGLVDHILEGVGSEPGNLPLLEFLLTQLWDRRERGLLTHGAYAAIGGVKGAIATRAEAELEGLTPEQREALRRVMIRLVTPGEGQADTRARAQMPGDAAAQAVVRLFADARLLTTGFDEATGHETVEVSHEALIREWSTYRGWVDADREFLRTVERVKDAMRAWADEKADKDSRLLARGRPLEEARELLSRPHAFIDDIRPFIKASIAHDEARVAEEQRRIEAEKQREIEQARKVAAAERGRRRAAVVGLVVALVFAIAAGWFGWSAVISENAAVEAKLEAQRALADGDYREAWGKLESGRVGGSVPLLAHATRVDSAYLPGQGLLVDLLLRQSWLLSPPELRHEGRVVFAQFSPDGMRVITASWDNTARVWDARSGKALTEPLRHEDRVNSAEFSPDGTRVLTASGDNTARVWDAGSGRALTEPLRHEGSVASAEFSPDGTRVVTASWDKTARVWDARSGGALTEPLRHEGAVNFAQFSRPDGTRVLTASEDKTARVWDARSGKALTEPLRHEGTVYSAEFSPDGTRVVTASGDNTARVWDAGSGKALTEPLRHEGSVFSAQFSPDGTRVVTASGDKTARVWDAGSGKALTEPLRHEDSVASAQFGPDGTRVLTASADKTARVWDTRSGKALTEPLRHESWVRSAEFSPDGTRVVTASGDNTARVWDVGSGKALTEPLRHEREVFSAQFSPDGTRVVTASGDKTARVWDARSGEALTEPLRHEGRVVFAQFSRPDGTRVLTASEDKTARVWDARSGEALTEPLRHEREVFSAQFSPDGTRVVTASGDKTARVWDARSGKALTEPLRHEGRVVFAQFSSDGTRVVTASEDKTARVWDARSGKALTEPLRHEREVFSAQFSPDGTRVVTASGDKTARVWDARSGKALTELRHEGTVYSAEFSPDGTRVLTASWGETARVWDARSGKTPLTELRHEDQVRSAQFSPDGTRVVTAPDDKTARVWDARSGKALTEPLRHEDRVVFAQFSPDGTRVLTASKDNTARVWDVFTVSPNDAELVASLAEAVVGYRLNEQGLVVRITDTVDRLAKLREETKDATEADGNGRVFVRWFLADRWTRTISPFSSVTVPEHLQRLIDAGKTDEAVGEFPGHPLLLKLHQQPAPAVPSADKATDTPSQP